MMALMFCIFFPTMQAKDIEQVVAEFHKLNSQRAELLFIEKYEKNTEPSLRAYVLAAKMKQAEYSFNPITKLSIFNKNMRAFNELVEQHPNDVHARYMRLVIEEKVSFLHLNNNIRQDKAFLQQYMLKENASKQLIKFIKQHTTL